MKKKSKQIGLMEAVSIGIGGMVGGGIFAVLGLAVFLAKGGTAMAFLVAGIITLFTSYSYAKMSLAYPDRGGTVKFINVGFGKTVFSGGINNLLWISYIIMLSLYSTAFGSYAPNILSITGDTLTDRHLYISFIILFSAAINYYSIKVVGAIESYAVIIKLIILVGFVVLGIYGLFGNPNVEQLSFADWVGPLQLFVGGMVIFVAYEGFELIANAVPDLKNPEKNVSRAYYITVVFVIVLYILIAVVTVGSLPFKAIAHAQDYVLAEAAKPMLGKVGFSIITIAALISTFSAINATLYGGSRVNYELAEDDELPHEFTKVFWNQPVGLAVTTVITLVAANVLNLTSISTAGSLGFLIIFAFVNFAAYRNAAKLNAKKNIPLAGFILCTVAFLTLIVQQFQTNETGILIALGIIFVSFLTEYLFKKSEKHKQAS